jgi:N-acyl-D-aspartate/D-glutamate deacylase
MTLERAVHRLTGELADWYHLDAGHLRVGDWADILVVDPERLDSSLDGYHEAPIDAFGGLKRMVNRNDDTVKAVLVAGRTVFVNGEPTELVGAQRTGSFLRADGRPRNAPVRNRFERPSVAAI